MEVVYNGCHSNQSTVECDVSNMAADDVNKMADADAGAGAGATNTT
jgi:hypothetical protein